MLKVAISISGALILVVLLAAVGWASPSGQGTSPLTPSNTQIVGMDWGLWLDRLLSAAIGAILVWFKFYLDRRRDNELGKEASQKAARAESEKRQERIRADLMQGLDDPNSVLETAKFSKKAKVEVHPPTPLNAIYLIIWNFSELGLIRLRMKKGEPLTKELDDLLAMLRDLLEDMAVDSDAASEVSYTEAEQVARKVSKIPGFRNESISPTEGDLGTFITDVKPLIADMSKRVTDRHNAEYGQERPNV